MKISLRKIKIKAFKVDTSYLSPKNTLFYKIINNYFNNKHKNNFKHFFHSQINNLHISIKN